MVDQRNMEYVLGSFMMDQKQPTNSFELRRRDSLPRRQSQHPYYTISTTNRAASLVRCRRVVSRPPECATQVLHTKASLTAHESQLLWQLAALQRFHCSYPG